MKCATYFIMMKQYINQLLFDSLIMMSLPTKIVVLPISPHCMYLSCVQLGGYMLQNLPIAAVERVRVLGSYLCAVCSCYYSNRKG